jgi:PhoH-like ATPase
MLVDRSDRDRNAIGRYHRQDKQLIALDPHPAPVFGLTPRNLEQRMALDLLMDDRIPLVTLLGTAGTGKTLMALAVGMQKVLTEDRYKRLLVSRPIIPLGKDIGYLPGTKDDKLSHWMGPIFDNLEFLLGERPGRQEPRNGPKASPEEEVQGLVKDGVVSLEALTYIRGRSISNHFMVVDEAQNLTPHEIKTIISRAGEGTKVVLTGDPYQIDNPYLDSNSNGLTYVVERLRGQTIAGHLTLTKSERSTLAALAADLL